MLTVDQALAVVLDHIRPLGTEIVPLDEAPNRILAEPIKADIDLPPFDRARMDGYAVRSADVRNAPVVLRVIGEVAAGIAFDGRIGEGEAVKIFTGAPIPDGADAVQKVEVTNANRNTVEILEPVHQGQFVTPRASEVAAGEIVSEAGVEVGPAEMSVLASFGYWQVKVGRRPRVAVISTGSELVEVSSRPSAAQIRNSNSYALGTYAERSGAIVDRLGTVEDTAEATRKALLRAANASDAVISSGGVSMGDYDLVKAALRELGAEIYFDKVTIRPGKPIVFARLDDTWFFGLPGNPVSTSVTFNVFVRPALRRMQGESSPLLPTVRARLDRSVRDSSSRRSYLPARLSVRDGQARAEPLRWGGSSDLVAFMRANSLIVVQEDVHALEEGEFVDVMVLRGIES